MVSKEVSNYITEIEDKGYTVVKNAVSIETAKDLLDKIEKIFKNGKKPDLSKVPKLNKESKVVYNPEQKDILFCKVIFSIKKLRKILIHFLNDEWYKEIPKDNPNYILRAMIARSSSYAKLPLHIDSFIPSSGNRCFIMQASLVLNEQTINNGCTVVVPGSHKSDQYATQEFFNEATPISASMGDLIIWDSRLWHGALPNKTGVNRWSLISTFTRWWIKQNYQLTNSIPKTFLNKFTDEELSILGFCSDPPKDEFDRIDIKAGYDILNQRR